MTSSGTYNFASTFAGVDVIEEAYERCGVQSPMLDPQRYISAVRSLNLLFADWANKGINLWKVEAWNTTLVSGTTIYTPPARTVSLFNVAVTLSGQDVMIGAVSRAEYQAIADKTQQGQPNQYYLERTIQPQVYIWPVPDQSYPWKSFIMAYQEDVTSNLTQTMDAPQRWLEAICSGLAMKLAVKWAPDRLSFLAPMADAAYTAAMREDEEKVPTRFTVDASGWQVH